MQTSALFSDGNDNYCTVEMVMTAYSCNLLFCSVVVIMHWPEKCKSDNNALVRKASAGVRGGASPTDLGSSTIV